jgi:hypothetical protein
MLPRLRRLWSSAAVVLLAWSVAVQPALAQQAQQAQPAQQSAGDEARKADARTHFQRGLELSDDQAWDAAYAEYVTSIGIYPTKAATKNAALCLRMMHRYAEALDMLESFTHFSNLTPEDRSFADREMRDLKRFVGQLVVNDAAGGAQISVDGGDRGKTPLSGPLRVTAGSHVLRAFKPGFAPFERQLVIAGGQTVTVDVKLEAITQGGRLRVVDQTDSHAQVLVDGAAVGTAPWEGAVGAGTHTAALKGEGALGTQPVSVPVKLNETATITLSPEPLEAQLRVEPTPASAMTALDGVTLGRGVWEGPVRKGDHKVEVAEEGFLSSQQNVRLDKGGRRVLAVQLERDPNSPMWRTLHPPHLFLEAQAAAPLFPSLGGDLNGGCSGSCSPGLAFGVLGELRAGYELSSGIGFSIDGGYAWVQQSISGRSDALNPEPVGQNKPDPGTTSDTLRLQGPIVTASASFHRGEKLTWLGRVGLGAWFANVSDSRSGTYTTVLSENPLTRMTGLPPVTYSVSPVSESVATVYGALVPEFRVGWRLGDSTEVGFGVQALLALPLSATPRWNSNGGPVPTGNCGATPNNTCVTDGQAVYSSSSLTGSVVVLIAPVLSFTYSL